MERHTGIEWKKRYIFYSSAKHSIRIVELPLEEIVDEVEATLSN